MAQSSGEDRIPRPSTKLYAQLVETYSDQKKVDHHEVSIWLGIPRTLCEHAYKKGWRGDKRGNRALAPIRDVVSRMRFGASALTEKLEMIVTQEGEKELTAAIRDGTVKRAVEGLVSRGFLKIIQETVDNAMAMQAATKPLVERLISQLVTLADVKKLTMVEIKSELAFVQAYSREAMLLTERYHATEKLREANKPANLEDKAKMALGLKSETELINDFVAAIEGVKNALGSNKSPRAPVMIDVTPEPAQSSSSSSSSSSRSSDSSSSSSSSS